MTNKIINGGLELKKPTNASASSEEKKHDVTNFDPVSSMLNDPSSSLGIITASSLKGFIFKLDVEDGKSTYTEYNLQEEKQVEVTHFALKVVVISDKYEGLIGRNGNGNDKTVTITEKKFKAQAATQQEIWKQTHLTVGGEIAPSVGDVVILEGKYRDNLLDELIRKRNASSDVKSIAAF